VTTRQRRPVLATLLVIAATAAAAIAPATAGAATWYPGKLAAPRILTGLSSPTALTNAGDGTNRLFVVQQAGTVRVVQGNSLKSGYFLDIRGRVASGGERGLLGLAFHPDFESNRRLFVYYTRNGGDVVISRFTTNTAGTDVNEGSEAVLQVIEHSANTNHNGGSLAFGPDGYLYIGVGDGGGAGDQPNNAQDKGTYLGKIMRIDVDGTGAGTFGRYANPTDNPFYGSVPGNDGIWAYGLRNPWRISFDRATGEFWIADVGQNRYEEINRQPASHNGGRNYGWRVMEGKHCYNPSSGCNTSGKTMPIAEYSLGSSNCSVIGGYTYRGASQQRLVGVYTFADFCSGNVWRMPATSTNGADKKIDLVVGGNITSFGESESGEIYFVTIGGGLYRLVAPEFSDIASSSFIDDIHWLLYEDLTAGCSATKYCPAANVTREQMAIFLDRALDLPSTGTDFFSDDEGVTGEGAINRLAASGITSGCTATTFCPTATVTREQMAIFLDRALDLPSTGTDFFTDDTGRTGEGSINRLAASGITTGCSPTTYCPTAGVTRGQMAAFLRRSFD
jgi:glucose/arabinose dehydrogenase